MHIKPQRLERDFKYLQKWLTTQSTRATNTSFYTNLKKAADRLPAKWIFPILILTGVAIAAGLGLHGSSVGRYNVMFYGKQYDDKNLLLNNVRSVRSDEWLSTTPYTISQFRNDYPRINDDLGHAHDMTVANNVPVLDWTAIFKPQNWSFFVLPLEQAFAFKWWFMSAFAALLGYLFALEFFTRRKLTASLLGLIFLLSPYMFWWYGDIVLMAPALGLLCLVALKRIHEETSTKRKLWWSITLFYALCTFILGLYPPFQLAIIFVTIVFYLGYLLETKRLQSKSLRKNFFRDLRFILPAVTLAVGVLGAFIITRLEAFKLITGTVYPAGRTSVSGDGTLQYLLHLLSSPFQYRLQFSESEAYITNQSDSSQFFFLFPFLLLPITYLILKHRAKGKQLPWMLITTMAVIILIFVRLFVPFGNTFFKLILFDKIPNNRLMIMLGYAGFLFLVMSLRLLQQKQYFSALSERFIRSTAIVSTFILTAMVGHFTRNIYPDFLYRNLEILIISLLMTIIVALLLYRKFLAGLLLLTALSLASVFAVHPVYRGLSPLTESRLNNVIRAIVEKDPEGRWMVNNYVPLEHFPLQAGAKSISGEYNQPQLTIWGLIDPEGEQEEIYNRGAHAITSVKQEGSSEFLSTPVDNMFVAAINPCTEIADQLNLKYILSIRELALDCLVEESMVAYPALHIYIYQIKRD